MKKAPPRPQFRNGPPPDPGKRFWPVVTPKQNATLRVILLDNQWQSVPTHWDGRTIPCSQSSDCAACWSGRKVRWVAFTSVAMLTGGRAVLQVTGTCCRKLQKEFESEGVCRGYIVSLTRRGKTNNSPIEFSVQSRTDLKSDLPDPFSVKETVENLWGYQPHLPFSETQEPTLGGNAHA